MLKVDLKGDKNMKIYEHEWLVGLLVLRSPDNILTNTLVNEMIGFRKLRTIVFKNKMTYKNPLSLVPTDLLIDSNQFLFMVKEIGH